MNFFLLYQAVNLLFFFSQVWPFNIKSMKVYLLSEPNTSCIWKKWAPWTFLFFSP